ncbi:MAG: SprB repeat-containing protein, partial [Bacteroidota bacterium]
NDGDNVVFEYVNNATVGGCDRDFILDYVTVGTETYQTETDAIRNGPGSGQELGGNGSFDFGSLACEIDPCDNSPLLANITCAEDPLLTRTASNSTQTCSPNTTYGVFFASNGLVSNYTSSTRWPISSASFVENANGTAIFTAHATDPSNNNLGFDIVVNFRGRTFIPPTGSPKENTQCVGNLDNSDWYYYTEIDGVFTGTGTLSGGVVLVTPRAEAFQIGTGANLNDANAFGASGWITYEIKAQPNTGLGFTTDVTDQGDFNINLSGDTPDKDALDCFDICKGESLTIFANGNLGTPPYSYLWSTGATTPSITVSPTADADYSVTITDANGCSDHDDVHVTVNDAAWDHVNKGQDVDNCDGNCNGSIIVDANFAVTGEYRVEYTFNGSVVQVPGTFNGGGDFTIDHLCAGTYSDITIIGVHTGCSAVWPNDITITEPTAPTVTVTGTDASCDANDGTATASISGGTGPFSYNWSNGGTTQTITGLSSGTYSVTVTDHNGCTGTGSVTISNTTSPLANITCDADPLKNRTVTNSNPTCFSEVYAVYIQSLVSNYTSNRYYTISGGNFQENSNGTATFTGMLVNQGNPDVGFYLSVVFRGRTFTPPAGSPKENTQCVGDLDNSDWHYYTETEGALMGTGDLAGATILLSRRDQAFQVGTGANLNQANVYGASGWFTLTVKDQPTNGPGFNANSGNGDFNFSLSGTKLDNEPTECLDICLG